MVTIDCETLSTREINRRLAGLNGDGRATMIHPKGRHNLAVGMEKEIRVLAEGHAGYYFGGMNRRAHLTITGNVGPGVGENMMSGVIHVEGYASASAGASARGGLLIIDGDASIRAGISLKGGEMVIGGNVGNMCGFMAQAGTIVVCGDAETGLGDSLYEAVIYLRGSTRTLGADARVEEMKDRDFAKVTELLKRAGRSEHPKEFKRIASAKTLYHFDANRRQEY